ncbi:MAG: FAD-dependent oxidoreductase [Flaviaesturariibacter sp.]|nr:FAD-dependent oxidoreductase [Flaviaesturariibacter sp.]
MQQRFDAIVIGAGASGLMAALELGRAGRKVAVLEATDRIGGRIDTVPGSGGSPPIERGAEFIHGRLPITLSLLEKAGIPVTQVEGRVWRSSGGRLEESSDFIEDPQLLLRACRALDGDIPVSRFVSQQFGDERHHDLRTSLLNYVQGYYAANPDRASAKALCRELSGNEETQYRVTGGYGRLVDYLQDKCLETGCFFALSAAVASVERTKGRAVVYTSGKTFEAAQVLCTVPVGALQRGDIGFHPEIPQRAALMTLGFGPVIKVILRFRNRFWADPDWTGGQDVSKAGFFFSNERIPTWWTQLPAEDAMLTGWCGGPPALAFRDMSDDNITEEALQSLAHIFGCEAARIRPILASSVVASWIERPFTNGAYSYEVVQGAEAQQALREPVDDTLFFAGEGLYTGPSIGTVEAALHTGLEAARLMIARS